MKSGERVFNRNFLILSLASLLMFGAFYLLMPIIAMYVVDEFGASPSLAGIVVSSYIITALLTRPFSGYMVDRFDRKKFYMIIYVLFAILFAGYIISESIGALILTRVFLGATFATLTTSANTLAIDITPSTRRAEGIGYYGAIVVLSMAVGPMAGLYLKDLLSYKDLFIIATICCWVGVVVGSFIRTKPRHDIPREAMSLDRFLLIPGVPIATVISLMYFMYGTLMAYVSLYVRESGLEVFSASFFLYFAIGTITARFISGALLRRNAFYTLIGIGIPLVIAAGLLFTLYLTNVTFVIASLAIGFGFGVTAPSIQTMIINLAPASRRGTANSTYFIALDLGSGIGMLVGGMIANIWSYKVLYLVAVALIFISFLLFLRLVKKNPQPTPIVVEK